jgi:UDP-2,4-diacetamido-2,4,6-trideoxy-beta-L-altropyranose hydrolase
MSRNIAIFCFSASPVIGSGHSVRCHALAQELKETGWIVKYILGKETISTVPYLISETGAIYATYDSVSELPDILSSVGECELLILDDYSINNEIETLCRNFVNKIAVIEDIPSRLHDCDFLIDQTPGRKPDEYNDLIPSGALKLVGEKYVLLRKEFLGFRHKSYKRKKQFKKNKSILISYGSLDEHDLICKTIELINEENMDVSINIIISSASKSIEKIKSYQNNISNIKLYIDVENVAEVISNSDLAIGAAGLSSLERCCLGLPSIIIETSDNQRELAKGLAKNDCANYLGKFSEVNWKQVGKILKKIMKDDEILERLSSVSMAHIDGHGAMRVAISLLPKRCTVNGDFVSLRMVEYSDKSKIYKWQIQPLTRKYSKNKKAPTVEEHNEWFSQKMNSKKCAQTIIQCNKRDVGVLRFEQNIEESDDYVISIYLDSKEYGKGIGVEALLCGRDFFPDKIFIAEIMDENIPSRKIFTKAGFKPISAGIYQSFPVP